MFIVAIKGERLTPTFLQLKVKGSVIRHIDDADYQMIEQ
jgi:hypothetical protein